jgi:uncharacterized protein (TIRG00374 family)
MNRFVKPVSIAGLIISAAFLVWALHRLEWSEIRSAFLAARLWPWVPLAIASYVAGQFVRGARCSFIVSAQSRLPVITASNVVVVGYAANNVLPARLGELVRAGLLADRAGIPLSQALAITFLERVLDGWVLLLLLGAGCLTVPVPAWVGNVVLVGATVFVAATLLILFCVLTPNWMLALTARAGGLFGDRIRDRALRLVMRAAGGLACLRRPRNTLFLGIQSLLVWLFEAGMFLLLFPAFGIAGDIWWAIWAMTVTNLGIIVPSSPGYIGTFHVVCQQALIVVGVAEATALSFAATVHLTFYIPVTLWGLAAMLRYGVEIGATVFRAHSTRAAPGPSIDSLAVRDLAACPAYRDTQAREPGERIMALAEALLPDNTNPLSNAHFKASRRAAAFARDQIDSLPFQILLIYRAGMVLFRFLARVRYGRTFEKLPLQRRRAFASAWAYGPFFFARQLLRPVRCCALLAYYEHLGVPGEAGAEAGAKEAPVEHATGAAAKDAKRAAAKDAKAAAAKDAKAAAAKDAKAAAADGAGTEKGDRNGTASKGGAP